MGDGHRLENTEGWTHWTKMSQKITGDTIWNKNGWQRFNTVHWLRWQGLLNAL